MKNEQGSTCNEDEGIMSVQADLIVHSAVRRSEFEVEMSRFETCYEQCKVVNTVF